MRCQLVVNNDMPATATLPVSVIILTNRFDQRCIECLNAAKWASQIVIGVDGDVVRAEIRRWLATSAWRQRVKLIPTAKSPVRHFAQERNHLQLQATQPWLLWLDSDEVLPQDAEELIAPLLSQPVSGYSLLRRDVFHSQVLYWGEVQQVRKVRLFRRGQGRWQGNVHETVLTTGQVNETTIELHHYAHNSLSDFWQKIVSYARLAAAAKPAQPRWQLGVELLLWPVGKLCLNMVLRQGWRDGWRGWCYSWMLSAHSLLVRIFAWQGQEKQP